MTSNKGTPGRYRVLTLACTVHGRESTSSYWPFDTVKAFRVHEQALTSGHRSFGTGLACRVQDRVLPAGAKHYGSILVLWGTHDLGLASWHQRHYVMFILGLFFFHIWFTSCLDNVYVVDC